VRLKEARLTLGRARALVRDGISGQADLDKAEAEVDALEARLDLTAKQVTVAERARWPCGRSDLDDTVIRAPFAGVAISKDAQPGEMVSPVSAGGGFTRTGISTIVDMSSLEIEVDVNESFINRVTPGQKVDATLDAYPDWKIPGHSSPSCRPADRQKATVLVRIGFEQLDPRILPTWREGGVPRGAGAGIGGGVPPAPHRARAAIRTDQGRLWCSCGENRVERRAVRWATRKATPRKS